MPERAGRRFYSRGAEEMARRLLGQRLVRVLDDGTRLSGIIVETEAYLGVRDRAAHSFGGRRTPRVEPMYGPPGTAYVYFTYGMHHCFNVVCGARGEPVAVLVRALEPAEGIARMKGGREVAERDLCRGPGRLCRALDIGRPLSGIDLTADPRLFIETARRVGPSGFVRTARIGVGYAGPWANRRLRWGVAGNRYVSGPKGGGQYPKASAKPGTRGRIAE